MKPNIVFLDEYTLGGADLGPPARAWAEYTGYSPHRRRTSVADRCREADVDHHQQSRDAPRDASAALPRAAPDLHSRHGHEQHRPRRRGRAGHRRQERRGLLDALRGRNHPRGGHRPAAATSSTTTATSRAALTRPPDSSSTSPQPTHQLYGSKWGIVGLGAIGHEVARLAAAFGCEVRYTSTSGAVREKSPTPPCRFPNCWAGRTRSRCTRR